MRNTLETRLGIFFALALVAGVIVIEMAGSFDRFKKGHHLRARFESVQELKAGDPVKLAGVRVGRVDRIGFADDKVEVTVKIDPDAKVKTDSKATIKFVGLMGQNYVSIDFGSRGAPIAGEDALLDSVDQADLSALMAKLDNVAGGIENLTKSFSGDNFSNMLAPFSDFLKENSPRLSTILENMRQVSVQVAEGKGTVGKLLMDETLHNAALETVTNLNSTAQDIRITIAEARRVVDNVNSGQGTLGRLMTDPSLFNEATNAVVNMRQIFEKINQGQGSVGKLLNDESMFKNVKMTLQKVEKATEGLEDQGPLSVLGIAVNSLF